MTKVYNFSAGPAVLPKEVIKKAQDELTSFKGSQMSVMEISHRSSLYTEMFQKAEEDLRYLMEIPDDYDILFQQGGATLQFTAVPLNLANNYRRIGYIDTGHWSQRAYQEAELLHKFDVDVVASSKDSNYTELVHQVELENKNYDYVHLTTNNTIEGTMYRDLPSGLAGQTIVADMSSNILGQKYNVDDFGLIYAGAQKNIGIAGLTVVIVKRDLIGKVSNLPSMLDYKKQADKQSALNTPPVFAIYMAGLVFEWLKEQDGVAAMQALNEEKSQLLYEYLDNSTLFSSPVKREDRSLTNIPFVTGNKKLDEKFIAEATSAGLLNLKGHRLVGGMRASLYNAFELEGVKVLVDFMKEFELKNKGE